MPTAPPGARCRAPDDYLRLRGGDSAQARRASARRSSGILATSHNRMAANRARLTGGLETTTYAAAAPADTTIKFATVRAALSVMSARQLRSDPVTALVVSRA